MFIYQDENDESYEEVEGEVVDVFDSDFDDDVSIFLLSLISQT